MKRTFKKAVCVFLVVAMLLCAAPLSGFVGLELPSLFDFKAQAATYSGTCGANIMWTCESGVLRLSGTGPMKDLTHSSVPWSSYGVGSVIIDDGITTIGDYAFYYCQFLSSVTIPDSVTSIGDYAFGGCYDLTDITIPDSVTTIGSNAFYSCDKLTNLPVGNSPISIGDSAFASCSGLTDVIIPDNVISVGKSVFSGCYNLKSITIGSGLANIGDGAFSDTYKLEEITVDADNLYWMVDSYGVLCSKDMTRLVQYPVANTRPSYTVPDSVTSIDSGAFAFCYDIANVTLPDSLKTIGEYVFVDCYNLSSVTMPAGMESIGQYAFGWYATPYFNGTLEQWQAVETDPSDTSILSRVIICGGTDRPYYIPGTCGTKVNWILYADGELVISGSGAMTNFKTEYSTPKDNPWYNMREKIKSVTVEYGVTSIGNYAFYDCDKIQKVTLADTVSTIGSYAFYFCLGIDEFTIPASATFAGSTTFYGANVRKKITISKGSGIFPDYSTDTSKSDCYRYTLWYESRPTLEEIVIEDGVTSIGSYAFNSVTHLKSIRIPASVTEIDIGAFGECIELTDIHYTSTQDDWDKILIGSENEPLGTATIHTVTDSGTCGDNLTWLLYDTGRLEINGTGAMTSWSTANKTPWFNYRTEINEIIIGDGVTSVGKYAFYSCMGKKSVTIPDSVTSIEANAFGNSQSITEIHYASDKSDWEKITVGSANNALNYTQFNYGVKRLIGFGHVGELVEWELYTDGELSVIGEGGMSNYASAEYYPWHKHRDKITSFTLDTYPGEYYPEMTNIGSHALEGCSNLETVKIYSVLRTIGDYAFAGCTSLETFIIPDTVTDIGDGAFYGCSGLNELTMPVSAKIYNSPDVFYGCTSIGKITLTKGNGTMVSYGMDTSVGSSSVNYKYTPWYISLTQVDLTIEEGITAISPYAFYGSKSIKNATVPEGVTAIGEYAFCGNAGLKNVTLPASITSIGVYAFYGCSALENTYYNGDIIGWCNISFKDAYSTPMCFADNLYLGGELVTEVHISSTVTSISNYTFYGCSGIKDVYYGSTEEDWNKISIGSYNEPLTSATIHFNTTQCKHSTDELIWHTVVEPTCASGRENAVCSVCGYNGCYEVLCDSATYPNCVGNNQEWVDKTYSFTYPGAEKLILKFSEKTDIYEYLYIYNAKGDMIGCYTPDSQLSGETVEVDGDSVELRIVAETLYSWCGFSFDSIIAVMYVDGWIREKNASEDYPHDWSYEDGKCVECGYQCPHKNVSNGVCTECSFCNHVDADSDEMCDNCGGIVGAKILTVDLEGRLYADGDLCYAYASDEIYISSGKYKLTADITTSSNVYILQNNQVVIDLNGYIWDMGDYRMSIGGEVSLYDSSVQKTGKLTSSGTTTVQPESYTSPVFNLYSGTVENTSLSQSAWTLSIDGTANLYGGKIKSEGYALRYSLGDNSSINLDGAVLESGEGYAQVITNLGLDETAKSVIDVADHVGDNLTIYVETNKAGKIKIFKGIQSVEDSDRYIVYLFSTNGNIFIEKEEYDPETGEKYISVVENACIRQPSANNNFTADFNNDKASLQWYETDKIVLTEKNTVPFEYEELPQATTSLDKWVVKGENVLFSCDVKAGSSLYVSSESYRINAYVYVGDRTLAFNTGKQPDPITFDTDTTLHVRAASNSTTAVLGFTLIINTPLEGETSETLQNPECGKSYFCRATTQGIGSTSVVDSDTVSVTHAWNDGVCSICRIDSFVPLNGMIADGETGMIYGLDAGVDSLNEYTALAADNLKWAYKLGEYGFGTGTVATLKRANNVVAEYTVVIFGDVDGNGWYDANDAFIVNMIASGLLDKSKLSEAMQKAADCNHDGAINELDFDLLIDASVLLDDVDQSATQPELVSNAFYIQYCSLIDQSAGADLEPAPTPETELSDQETNQSLDTVNIEAIFATVFEYIIKIFAFVFSLIK